MNNHSIVFAPLPKRSRFVDISNRAFGMLTVLGFAGEDRDTKQVRNLWWCRCDCGTVFKPRGDHLKSGNTTNCGCVRRVSVGNIKRTHGHCANRRPTSEYSIWCAMIRRCNSINDPAYEYYGGRGIIVCPAWRESFEAFFGNMGPRPKRHSVERLDTNGNYEPRNCRWATHHEQMQNTRRNHLITFQGETLCVTEWARRVGISSVTLFSRLHSGQWSVERALSTPLLSRGKSLSANVAQ
jgi:hypothetical protein